MRHPNFLQKCYNLRMPNIPTTRISILTAISNSADSARWAEFVRAYEEPMRGFLRSRFPSLEPEDVMQETLLALVKALPNYRYTPDEKGHFRNYLMGILNHKACDVLRRRTKENEKRQDYRDEMKRARKEDTDAEEERTFREALMNSAIEQLLGDDSINPTHREIFRHVILLHEQPADVAELFGVTRNNVDQIKNRLRARLSDIVKAMDLSDQAV